MNQLPKHSVWMSVLLISFFEFSLAGVALFVGLFININPFDKLHFTWIAVRGGVLPVSIPLLLFVLLLKSKSLRFQNEVLQLKRRLGKFFKQCTLLQFLLISISAGVGEEFLFRGLLQEGLIHLVGAWPALIITGVLFGMAHWVSNYYFIYATFMGMFLGALYWQSGNLLAPIICHALYDFVVLIFLTHRTFKKLKD